MPNRYVALAGVVAAVVLAYVGFWIWAAETAEDRILSWAEERRAAGAQIAWRALERGGFPFRLSFTFVEPQVAMPSHPRAPEWRGERVIAVTQPWRPRHVLVGFEGEQTVSFDEPGGRRSVAVRAESWRASWQADAEGRLTRLSVDLQQAEARDSAATEPSRAARLQLHARPGQQPGALADLAVKAEGLRLAQAADAPLGPVIELAEMEATVMGPLVADVFPEVVLRWRDEGGVIEVRRAALQWGEVRAEANGTVTLDSATRPEGAFTTRIWNHRALLNALRDEGALSADDARLATAALDVLAAAGGGAISAPLTLQNGKVWLGPAAVGRLKPLSQAAARNRARESPGPRR